MGAAIQVAKETFQESRIQKAMLNYLSIEKFCVSVPFTFWKKKHWGTGLSWVVGDTVQAICRLRRELRGKEGTSKSSMVGLAK